MRGADGRLQACQPVVGLFRFVRACVQCFGLPPCWREQSLPECVLGVFWSCLPSEWGIALFLTVEYRGCVVCFHDEMQRLKGIQLKLLAFTAFLEKHEECRGKVIMLQVRNSALCCISAQREGLVWRLLTACVALVDCVCGAC